MPRIIDAHVHSFGNGLAGVQEVHTTLQERGVDGAVYLSCEGMGQADQNALGIYFKLLSSNNYAYAGLNPRFMHDPAREIRFLIESGFDGVKMIKQKPSERIRWNIPFNDPCFDALYAYLSDAEVPLLAHVGDPPTFWDKDKIPAFVKGGEWDYTDGSYIPLETLRYEVDDVVTRFPNLRLILAHFYFYAHDLGKIDRWLDEHPNVSLDLVSGLEMYQHFSTKPEETREFFIKHQDRLIFGTDLSNPETQDDRYNQEVINQLQLTFLETSNLFETWPDQFLHGIELPKDVQAKILSQNFMDLHPNGPNSLDSTNLRMYLDDRLSYEDLSDEERTNIRTVFIALDD